jgi:hypothetical protein
VGDGIEGVWTNTSNGRQWTFRLRRAEQAATFEGPATTLDSGDGPIAFRTARVPASRHRVPLITEFHDPRVLNEVNTLLMFVANDSRCPAGVPDDYALEAKVSFAGAGLLSLRIVQSRMCQGARAAVVDRSRVYRLPDAVLLGFGNLFQHYRIPDDRLFAALFPYERSRVQAGSGLVAAGEDDRACHAVWTPKSFAEDGREPDFHLTAEGVVVRLQVPDGLAACANEVTVPYSAVGPVVWPSGGLARLAEANAGKPMRYRIHRPGTDPKDDILFTPSGK